MRFLVLLTLSAGLAACTAYEYEEEVFFAVDGSGSIRISGSEELLDAIHGASTVDAMRSRFEHPSFEIESVRQTTRDQRRYIHVQGSFLDWNAICRHPEFRDRQCRLERNQDEDWELSMRVPAIPRALPEDVAPDAAIAFRFHFPSSVGFHNSPNDIERGNIIRWERPASEHFDGEDLLVEARFERRSVLTTTLGVLGAAAATVGLTVTIALWWLVRKGRRQLEEDG